MMCLAPYGLALVLVACVEVCQWRCHRPCHQTTRTWHGGNCSSDRLRPVFKRKYPF